MGFPQSAIDWNKYMEGLNGKANGKFAVVEAKTNPDGSWYRRYSDGWLEQGGTTDILGQNYDLYTVTFIKPFVNTSYQGTVCISSFSGSENGGSYGAGFNIVIRQKETTNMILARHWDSAISNRRADWYACGQGA